MFGSHWSKFKIELPEKVLREIRTGMPLLLMPVISVWLTLAASCIHPEAVARRCSVKKVLLKNS